VNKKIIFIYVIMSVEYRRQEQLLLVCSFGARSIFTGVQLGSKTAPTGTGRAAQIVFMLWIWLGGCGIHIPLGYCRYKRVYTF